MRPIRFPRVTFGGQQVNMRRIALHVIELRRRVDSRSEQRLFCNVLKPAAVYDLAAALRPSTYCLPVRGAIALLSVMRV